MKKIINGKMYNTETAKCVGWWDNGRYGNFYYCAESLYRKKTGEYFLYGSGGAMSKYSESCDSNSWSGGCKIIPMTEAEAKRWAEQYLTGEEYEEVFGEVEE